MAGLKLLLLGSPRLERDNVPVDLERRKALALLGLFGGHRRSSVPRGAGDIALAGPWRKPGYAYLRRALFTLKQALGAEQVAIGPSASVWSAALTRCQTCRSMSHTSGACWPAALPMATRPTGMSRLSALPRRGGRAISG